MRLLGVSVGPFFTYQKAFWKPGPGLTVVTGANEAGKSALGYEAMLWGLFGETARGGPVKDARVEVELDVDGGYWKVERQRTSRASRLALTRGDADLSGATPTETQAKIDRLVGSAARFMSGRIFARDLLAKFALATDKQRKQLFEEFLGLGQFDRALKIAREEAADAAQERQAVDLQVPGVRAQILDLQGKVVALVAGSARLPEDVDAELAEVKTAYSREAAEWEPAKRRIDELQASLPERTRVRARMEADERHCHHQLVELARDVERASRAECEACGRPYDQEALAEAVKRAKVKLAEAQMAPDMSRAVAQARAAEGILQEELDDLLEAAHAHQLAQQQRRERHAALKVELELARTVGDQRERLEASLCRLSEELLELEARRASAADRQRVLEACVQAFGLTGARCALLGDALARVEAGANRVLARLRPGVEVRVSGTTTRGDGREVDKVSVTVVGAGGGDYRGCSGSQRARVDVALLLGLASLDDSGGLLVFDEVFDSLDAANVEAVAEYLRELAQERQVVVISHHEHMVGLFPGAARFRARFDGEASHLEAC